MKVAQTIHDIEQLKTLADPRRLNILRLLMAAPHTLSQLAASLSHSPAWVKHHILKLEASNLVELAEIRTTGTVTEKYYQAKAGALLLQQVILPQGTAPALLLSGSHDLALELLADGLSPHIELITQPSGSLNGLAALRLGLCSLVGLHLQDATGEYNTPYIRQMFPDGNISLVTLAYREQGLMTAPGNPKGIHSLDDLVREDVVFIFRNRGSGTRIWLEKALLQRGIPLGSVHAHSRVVSTHTEAAELIAKGEADAALGLHASARQQNLDFIPLYHERYDLAFPSEQAQPLSPLLEYIQGGNYRREVESLAGYACQHTGEQVL